MPEATEDPEPLEGNRLPATLELEFTPSEVQLRIVPETVAAYCDEHRRAGKRSYTCGLTYQEFTAPIGGVVWKLRRDESGFPLEHAALHPDVVAKGPNYIRRAAREAVADYRREARRKLEKAVLLERALELPITRELPE